VFVILALVGLNALLAFVNRPVRWFDRGPEVMVQRVAGSH